MGHRKKHAPHRGSLGYRRKRARRHTARLRTWPESSDSAEPRLLGHAGYKAGMTHLAMVNTDRKSPFFKQEQFVPVTIIETPPIVIFGIRIYITDQVTKKPRVMTQIWGENIEKDLSLRIKIPKEIQNKEQQINDVRKVLENVNEIRILAHTSPREAGFPQKAPDILEIKVGGSINDAFNYALKILDQKISIDDVYKPNDFIDVIATTKGKGFAGPVKRHGIKILPRKTRKGRRVVGCIGPWHPARVMWTVPRAGQLGYFARTEYNKQILKIGEDGEEVTPVSGFKRYGKVGKHCVLRGSSPGSSKRLIRLRDPVRPKPTEIEDLQITYISTVAKN
ncbi:MAG: 50S ribosomal protein L3 [Candidatus Heimdallarchaeota archaeon]|nr:MAG: 50S ribosomal protein L3 [Candidatus Heimdallarchaeota archaeon]